jgi:transposase
VEKARCEKLLEHADLKLFSVISDIYGVADRDMLTAIIAGQRNPKVLAQMVDTRVHTGGADPREGAGATW